MITCRIPSLAFLTTLLSASVAMSQIQPIRYAEPSSRQAATSRASNAAAPSAVAGLPTQTTLGAKTPAQDSQQQSGGWLKRLVLGNSEENAPDGAQAKSIEFSSQSSSRHATTTAPSSAAIRPLPPITNSPAQTPSSPPTSQNPAAQVTGTSRITGSPASTASNERASTSSTSPATNQGRGNWFQRVVLGQPQQDENKMQSVQLAPQPSSRQTGPLPSRQPAAQASAPIASARPATPGTTSPPAERSDRGWLSRLVLGQNKNDRTSTNSTAPPAKPAPAESLATRFGGLPAATTPSSSAPHASFGQIPVVTTHVAPREGSAQLANSLAAANEAAQPGRKIEPNSERSISLTNWISRLRKPDSAEQKPEPSYAHNPFNRPNASDTLQLNQALQQVSPQATAPMASSRNTSQAANPTPGPTGIVPPLAQNGMASPDSRSLEDSSNSLTNWISRPFRAMTTSDEDKELLTTRLPAPTSKSPVRLPTVAQTVSRPSPSASQRLQAQTLPLTSPAPYAASHPEQDRSAPVATAPIATAPPQSMPGDDSYRSIVAPSLRPPQSPAPSDIASLTRQFVPTPAVPTINAPSNATPHIETPNPSYQRTAQIAPPVVAPPVVIEPVLNAPPRMSLAQLPSSPPAADAEMYPQPAVDQTTDSPLGRPKIIFNPAVRGMNDRGQAVLKPAVQVAHNAQPAEELPPMAFATQTGEIPPGDTLPPPADYVGPEGMERPLAEYPSPDYWVPEEIPCEEPMTWVDACKPFLECGYTVLAHLNGPRSCPPGIGVENVMNAPFWIDTTQPLNQCRVRGDAAADLEFPDRIEYFWANVTGPKGPQQPGFFEGEPSVDYQDVSFFIERGGERFSVGTELPIRAVDPKDRFNTAGFADMRLTTKAVLLDGKEWQLTQVTHTHFPTGSFRRGTGNGHFSLEPGVAWRYKWSDVTYFHGDLTYWFPIAADLFHAGQMFNYGIGISHVWIDTDKWAIMPTLELNAWTLLDGRQTLPRSVAFEEIDTIGILNIHPGLRWVCDTAGDCGVREFGISSGIALTEDHWYEEILRLDLRWVF